MPPRTVADVLAERAAQAPEAVTQRVQDAKDQQQSEQLDGIQSSVIESAKAIIRYLDGKTTKTEVVNQLTSIGTPDVANVVTAIDGLHATLKTHENTDLSGVTDVLSKILLEAEKLPKSIPESPEQKFVDYSKQFAGLVSAIKSVETVVKAQKLIVQPTKVNVPKADIHVAAPNLDPLQTAIAEVVKAVKAIVIPEYKTDNTEVEKQLKATNKLLKELPDKMPSGASVIGGGGGVAAYKDMTGNFAPAELGSDGSVPTASPALATRIDNTTTAGVLYVGKAPIGSATSVPSWQITKLETSSGLIKTWAGATDSFSFIWDNRTSITYS